MKAMPRRDTGLELAVRRALYSHGLRYRLHRRPVEGLRCRADIVFCGVRVAVFCDSCFWHSCPDHCKIPKRNHDWWRDELAWTAERDERNNRALENAGWIVIRVWEHNDVELAALSIARIVKELRSRSAGPR